MRDDDHSKPPSAASTASLTLSLTALASSRDYVMDGVVSQVPSALDGGKMFHVAVFDHTNISKD